MTGRYICSVANRKHQLVWTCIVTNKIELLCYKNVSQLGAALLTKKDNTVVTSSVLHSLSVFLLLQPKPVPFVIHNCLLWTKRAAKGREVSETVDWAQLRAMFGIPRAAIKCHARTNACLPCSFLIETFSTYVYILLRKWQFCCLNTTPYKWKVFRKSISYFYQLLKYKIRF